MFYRSLIIVSHLLSHCSSECIRNSDGICPTVFDPVRCCDGNRYSNQCRADLECATGCVSTLTPTVCPTVYEPYCCDGRQYSNECQAQLKCEEECVPGLCSVCEPNPNGVCTSNYAPVCCNGKDYSNSCFAKLECALGCVKGECLSARMVDMNIDDNMGDIDLQLLLLNGAVSAVISLFVIGSGLTFYILLKKCKGKKYVALESQDIDEI